MVQSYEILIIIAKGDKYHIIFYLTMLHLHKLKIKNMKAYLGETIIKQQDTEFKEYNNSAWAMYFLEHYGGIDGAHHKDWVLDQIARAIKGTPIIIKLAKWDNGHQEYRISTGEPSQEYLDWVIDMCDGEDGYDTYSYNEGISP